MQSQGSHEIMSWALQECAAKDHSLVHEFEKLQKRCNSAINSLEQTVKELAQERTARQA